MNAMSLHPHEYAVKHGRFVAATEEQQSELLRQIGRNYYRRGRGIDACVTDEEADGWMACAAAGEKFGWKCSTSARGEDAYWLGMMQEAN